MEKAKPSKKKAYYRKRKQDIVTASDVRVNWKKCGKNTDTMEKDSDSEEDRTHPPARSFSKRKLEQPTVGRLDELDALWKETAVGRDFEVLANAPLSTNSFVFRSERNWTLDTSKYDDYFTVDVKNLADAMNCVPFNQLIPLDDKYFTIDELTSMTNVAEEATEAYNIKLERLKREAIAAEAARQAEEMKKKDETMSPLEANKNASRSMTNQPTSSDQSEEAAGGSNGNEPIPIRLSYVMASSSNANEPIPPRLSYEVAASSRRSHEIASGANANRTMPFHPSEQMAVDINTNRPMSFRPSEEMASGSGSSQTMSSRRSMGMASGCGSSQPMSSRRSKGKAIDSNTNQLKQSRSSPVKVKHDSTSSDDDLDYLLSLREPLRPKLVAPPKKSTSFGSRQQVQSDKPKGISKISLSIAESKTIDNPETMRSGDLEDWLDLILDQ